MKLVVCYCQEEQGNAALITNFVFSQLYITNKSERFNFKSGSGMRVAKLIKEDWPIVLQLKFLA